MEESGPILILFKCSKAKDASRGVFDAPGLWKDCPKTHEKIIRSRAAFIGHAKDKSPSISLGTEMIQASALRLYTGKFYEMLKKQGVLSNIEDQIATGALRCGIVSGGFGLLDASEPVGEYEAPMQKAATLWREKDVDLNDVMASLLLELKPRRVIGFLGQVQHYWGFLKRGVHLATQRGLSTSAVNFYVPNLPQGFQAIEPEGNALGECCARMLAEGKWAIDEKMQSQISFMEWCQTKWKWVTQGLKEGPAAQESISGT